jgi:hypothetical protein
VEIPVVEGECRKDVPLILFECSVVIEVLEYEGTRGEDTLLRGLLAENEDCREGRVVLLFDCGTRCMVPLVLSGG